MYCPFYDLFKSPLHPPETQKNTLLEMTQNTLNFLYYVLTTGPVTDLDSFVNYYYRHQFVHPNYTNCNSKMTIKINI